MRLCSPGTASSKATGSSSQPRTTAGAPASHESKNSASSASEANVAWWSSSTFVTTATSAERRDGAVGLVALDDEPPVSTPALPPSCGTTPMIQVGPARAREDEGDHRRGRRLPVRAADDDRAAQRDELGEEARGRGPEHAWAVERTTSSRPAAKGRRRRPHPRPRASPGRSSRARPSHTPRRPRHVRCRVGRKAGAADPDEVEATPRERRVGHDRASARRTSSSAISSAASGFGRCRASPRASARVARGRRAAWTRVGTLPIASWCTRSRRRPPRSSGRSPVIGRRADRGRGRPASRGGEPQTAPPARESARSATARAAPKRSVVAAARSPAGRPARAPPRSRARLRDAGSRARACPRYPPRSR